LGHVCNQAIKVFQNFNFDLSANISDIGFQMYRIIGQNIHIGASLIKSLIFTTGGL